MLGAEWVRKGRQSPGLGNTERPRPPERVRCPHRTVPLCTWPRAESFWETKQLMLSAAAERSEGGSLWAGAAVTQNKGPPRWVPLPLIWALDSALGPSGQGEAPGRPRHSRPPGAGREEAAQSSALGLTPSWILTRENQFLGLEVSPGDRTLLPSSPEVYGFLTPAAAFRHSLPSCDGTGDGGPQTEQGHRPAVGHAV